jgi:hypothetical protein
MVATSPFVPDHDPNYLNNEAIGAINVSGIPSGGVGMVAYWKFDESSGSTAFDETANDGTINEAGRGAGVTGNSLSFDGTDDYVNIPHDSTIAALSGLTMEAWVKPASGVANQDIIINKEYEYEIAWGNGNQLIAAVKTDTNDRFWTSGTGSNTLPLNNPDTCGGYLGRINYQGIYKRPVEAKRQPIGKHN